MRVQASDENGATTAVDLTVGVTNLDEAPVTSPDTLTTIEDTNLLIDPLLDLLSNDTDPEGQTLSLSDVANLPTVSSSTI